MSDVQSVLGIDLEDFEWRDLALCDGTMPTVMFYDEYEADEQVAKIVDEACLSCPVMAQCLATGIENNEHGVWGGIFLNSGKPDTNRNAHKTKEVWDEIKERIGGQPLHR